MRLALLGVLFLTACKIEVHNEARDASAPVPANAPASTTGFCPTAKKKPNACGWAEDGSACTACVTARCCEEGKACGRDCACVECSESATPAACGAHLASFNGAVACLKAKCAAECGVAAPASAPQAQTQGGACRATKCVEGAQGDALCRRAGCGKCFFGGCNGF